MFTEDHDPGLFALHYCFQYLGQTERLHVVVHLYVDAAVSAHGESGPQGFLRLLWADGYNHDFLNRAFFLQANGFFDRDFVEGVHAHLDVGEVDARAVGLDARLDVVIDHPFHGDEDFHAIPSSR